MKPNQNQQKAEELVAAMAQLEQVNHVLFARDAQCRRLLWELVRQMGGTAIIPERATPALWRLEFAKGSDGTIAINALEMAEPSKEQLDALAAELRGTDKRLEAVLETTALKDHPPAIIEHALSKDHVIFAGNIWLDAEIARAMQPQQSDPQKN